MIKFNARYFIFQIGVVTWTDIMDLMPPRRGKVRDVYDLGDSLLIVTTDRLSAHDVVLPTGILGKGKVLNLLSAYWFGRTRDIILNHLITYDIDGILVRLAAAGVEEPEQYRSRLEGRSMLVQKAKPYNTECIARGYLYGSMWDEYVELCKQADHEADRVVWKGYELPTGMVKGEMLPNPIFTCSTKASDGHDKNISFDELCQLVGKEIAEQMRKATLALYQRAADHVASRGIIICDTKFEFGDLNGKLILIDESVTPDSSRFWDATTYKLGEDQPSFDKQPVRDYLSSLDWNKTYPGPELPPGIVDETVGRYQVAFKMITGPALDG